jgi:hypothetical protein
LRDIDDAKLCIEQRTGEAAKSHTITESLGVALGAYSRATQYFSAARLIA